MTENRRIQCTDNGDTITFYDLNKPNQTVEFSKESQPYKLIEPLIKKDSNTNDLYIEENKNNQIIITKNGIYIGEINKNGQKHGKGIYQFSDGDRYEGEWENGQQHGKGIYQFSDGNRYKGNWENGQQHGKGICQFSDGSRYKGNWENGQQHGKGICQFSDGSRYEGEWENDQKHGKGVYQFSDGSRYEGEWENDQKHGKGILFKKFIEQDGTFENSYFIEGVGYTTTDKVHRDTFDPRSIKNGKIKLYDLKINKDKTKTITYYTQTGQSISININENGFITGTEPNNMKIIQSAFEDLKNLFENIPTERQEAFDDILAEIYMALNVTIMRQNHRLPIQIIDTKTNPVFKFEDEQEVTKTEQLIKLAQKQNPNGITIMPVHHLVRRHQVYMIVYPESMGKKIDIINTGASIKKEVHNQLKYKKIEVREFYPLKQNKVGNCVLVSTLVTERLLNSINGINPDDFPKHFYDAISLLPIKDPDGYSLYLPEITEKIRQSAEKLKKEQQKLTNTQQMITSCFKLQNTEKFGLCEPRCFHKKLDEKPLTVRFEELKKCIEKISEKTQTSTFATMPQ